MVILLLPATIYEVYRTEGKSTKASSVIMLLLLIAQIFLVFFDVKFNLAEFLGTSQEYIGGYLVPLGEIAVVIFITAFAIIYSIDSDLFSELFKYGVREGMQRL